MCTGPLTLEDGQKIACRKCWQCAERRIDDWVGRNIAENMFAKGGHSMTLTYGPDEFGNEDHPRAKWLTYSDVQKMLKNLRDHLGHQPRYFVAGEYGPANGRAHWHIIFHWQDEKIQFAEDELRNSYFNWKWWPHGFAFVDTINQNSVRYACKYCQKDSGEEGQGALRMSKKPLLGAAYFTEKARLLVEQGLAPRDPWYQFADIQRTDKSGVRKPTRFRMSGAALELFMGAYCRLWQEAHPDQHMPYTEYLEEWLDKRDAPAVQRWRDQKGFEALAAKAHRPDKRYQRDAWAAQEAYEKEMANGTEEQKEFLEYEKWREQVVAQRYRDREARKLGFPSAGHQSTIFYDQIDHRDPGEAP